MTLKYQMVDVSQLFVNSLNRLNYNWSNYANVSLQDCLRDHYL